MSGVNNSIERVFGHGSDMIGLSAGGAPRFEDLPDGVDASAAHVVPDDLELISPGRFLSTILSGIDRTRLSGHDTVRVLKARQRQISHEQAQLAADMVEISYRTNAEMGRADEAFEYASDEIRAALTLTRPAAESQLDFASDLYERYPQVWKALYQGHVDIRKARAIVDGVSHLNADTAGLVVEAVLNEAPDLTTGQLAARIQRLSVEVDPESARRKHQERLADRRITSNQNPVGTANLSGLDLAPNEVAAITGRIENEARRLKAAGDPRPIDQIRADIFTGLLPGRHLAGRHEKGTGVITMTAGLETLARLSREAADLPGLGPVIADIAQQVLFEHPGAEYRYKITGPNGEKIIGTPSRHATKALRRHVETRDETCFGIGCRMAATNCDIDHRQRHADGGPTTAHNSGPLCRHDHRLKDDDGGWHLRRNPDGSHTWTSRLGHTYTVGLPP